MINFSGPTAARTARPFWRCRGRCQKKIAHTPTNAQKKKKKNGGGGGENKKGTTDQQPPESIPPSYLALPSRTRSLLGFTEFSSIVSTCSLLVDRVKEKNDPKSHQTDFQLVLPGFSKQRTDETKNKETRAQKRKEEIKKENVVHAASRPTANEGTNQSMSLARQVPRSCVRPCRRVCVFFVCFFF